MRALSWAGIAFGVLFWWQVMPHVLAATIPPDPWMEVRNVVIKDSVVGVPPEVVVDRTIRRDFEGAYRVDVRRETPAGFVSWCARGATDVPYRTGAPFGEGRDLDWWMGIPPNPACQPPIHAGTYYAIVDWRIPVLWGYVTLTVTRQSNNFIISEVTP
jgi:hypothetical protein